MKHRHSTRVLSLLCALALFVSVLPAVSAAGLSKEILEPHIVRDTVTPAGVQINLFDYWVTGQTDDDTKTPFSNDNGINKDHDLRFMSRADTGSGADRINAYTGKGQGVRTGIVQDRLSGGYPVLAAGNATGLNTNGGKSSAQSLAYLFDPSEETKDAAGQPTGTLGKKTYWDVDGLLQIDRDGYYYYNADQTKVRSEANPGGSYDSANYAWFDPDTNAFTLYDTWGINKHGSGQQQGQFFPFTDPTEVDVFSVSGDRLTQANTKSVDPAVHHFFGVTMTTRFVQRYDGMTTKDGSEAMTFEFSGDDDVWIFIDGILVADLGGVHDQASTTINFSTGAITVGTTDAGTLRSKMSGRYSSESYWRGDTLANDTYHTLKLFYLERGGTDSNLAMKFNLAHVPETDGIKVDQYGSRLENVRFDLYAAVRELDPASGTYVYTKVNADPTADVGTVSPIGSGTTDANGRFVLTNADDIVVSLRDLRNRHIEYLILEEVGERTGYRHEENIYLVLENEGTDTILLNDEDHRWTTGSYAATKETVYTGPNIKLIDLPGDTLLGSRKNTVDLSADGGTLFGVIMRRLSGVGEAEPAITDGWGVVTGDALGGWTVTGKATSGESYVQTVLDALRQKDLDHNNAVQFTLASNGSYMAEFTNCPGDIRSYYFWLEAQNAASFKDAAYVIVYYYTEADSIEGATPDNTYRVSGQDFERQFAATIYIPNVKHELHVQKQDETGAGVAGVTFSLYEEQALQFGADGSYTINAAPYDTVITAADGKASFPSAGQLLAAGKYYLIETAAAPGFRRSAAPVRILVDNERGVLADAGDENDGVRVTVSEGHLVPTMTPFATKDDIDRSLTELTTTRMEAPSGWDNAAALAKTATQLALKLDEASFDEDHPTRTLRYIPADPNVRSLAWSTDSGWLWFHLEQSPIAQSNDMSLKTDLSGYDLTRLFTGETTVVVTNQRVGSLSVTKTVEVAPGAPDAPDGDARYPVTVTLTQGGVPVTGEIPCTDPDIGSVTFTRGTATLSLKAGQTVTLCDLPAGTAWSVAEDTAALPAGRWRTSITGSGTVTGLTASGTISHAGTDTVVITNRYAHYDEYTQATTGALPITKLYTAGAGETAYPGDVSFVLRDEAGTVLQTVSGHGSAAFAPLTFSSAGTYTYTVAEADGSVPGMTYDSTVYTATVTVTEDDAAQALAADVRWTKTINGRTEPAAALSFTNTYIEPQPQAAIVSGALNVRKQYTTDSSDPGSVTTRFLIDAVTDQAPMPNKRQLLITGAASDSFGTLVFNRAGTYTYTVYETPSNLSGLSSDPAVYTVTFTVTESGGKLTAQAVYSKDDAAYPYDGSEAPLLFTNTFKLRTDGRQTASLSIRKTVGAGIDTDLTFLFSVDLLDPDGRTGTLVVPVRANSSQVLSDLPVGTRYTVTELNASAYTVTAAGAQGTIPAGGAQASFHNALPGSEVPVPAPAPDPTPALDRRDHYAYIIGYPDGNVHPQGNITRAEVATIFFRLLRDPMRTQYWSQTNAYRDVPGDKWYNNAISTLSNMGIINGYPDGTFRPDAPITRAELTKIAAGFFADPRVAASYDGRFSDVSGAEWYISYLMTAIQEHLIQGYPDGSFRPSRPITRAEACTIVNRTLGRTPDRDHLLPEPAMITWPDNLDRSVWYYAQIQEATNSHDYRGPDRSAAWETWTAKLVERNWAALERTWSHAGSAPGGEVMP